MSQALRRFLEVARGTGDIRKEGQGHFLIGQCLDNLRRTDEALASLEQYRCEMTGWGRARFSIGTLHSCSVYVVREEGSTSNRPPSTCPTNGLWTLTRRESASTLVISRSPLSTCRLPSPSPGHSFPFARLISVHLPLPRRIASLDLSPVPYPSQEALQHRGGLSERPSGH